MARLILNCDYKMKKRCIVSKAEKMQSTCFFFLLARIGKTEETKREVHETNTNTSHPFLCMIEMARANFFEARTAHSPEPLAQ